MTEQRVLNPSLPLKAMIEKLAGIPLHTHPGTRWQYSVAVDVQGYLVEQLSGQPAGTRYLSPRTVQMMRTNHLQAEALKTMRPGTGWGMDFRVVMDAAAAGEPVSDGTFDWFGINGTWFWIDPVADLAFVGMIQHRGRTNGEIQGLSRNLVYQALLD